MKEKFYGEYHHSLRLCNLSKCQQLILSKQSIYLQAVYIFHGATSILDGLVIVAERGLLKIKMDFYFSDILFRNGGDGEL